MSKLVKLQRLRVANNALVGALPVHLLDRLAKLKDIRLYHNQVEQKKKEKMEMKNIFQKEFLHLAHTYVAYIHAAS